MKIIIGGAPHTGKSCFINGLKEAIKQIDGANYPYVIAACPDGEGSWFQETSSNDKQLAQNLKQQYKTKFTPEFVQLTSDAVENCVEPLVLVDIGGLIDEANERICKPATHAIILTKQNDDIGAWRAFCRKLDIVILAEITSDYDATEDKALQLGEDQTYCGSVHQLERGDLSVATRPTLISLAEIINQTNQQEGSI